MTEEERKYFLDLIKDALIVDIDDKEGQQTIDLNSINLCSVDYTDTTGNKDTLFSNRNIGESLSGMPYTDTSVDYNAKEILIDSNNYNNGSITSSGNYAHEDMNIINEIINSEDLFTILQTTPENLSEVISKMDSGSKAIIEFADKSVKDENPVNYQLYVKPGQEISEDTIIGEVEQMGKNLPIKSIFSSGIVLGTEDNSDFLRLYPSKCNRHIIIDNFQLGTNQGIDTEYLEKLINKFQQESFLYNLICNNLCYSVLPYILTRRNDFTMFFFERHNGMEIYNEYKEKIDKISKKFIDDIKDKATKENIKKTAGNYKKINQLGDELLEIRKNRLDNLIDLYNKKENLESCEYDPEFKDCHMLAAGLSEESKFKNRIGETSYSIGETMYFNYYMSLLANIPLISEEDIYTKEYYDILSSIIETRMAYEKYDIKLIEKEFEDLYYKTLDTKKHKLYKDIIRTLKEEILDEDVNFTNIFNWFKNHLDNSEEKELQIKQLSNIYLFIRTYQKEQDSVTSAIIKRTKAIKEWKDFEELEYNIDEIKKQFIQKYYTNIDPKHKYKKFNKTYRILNEFQIFNYDNIYNWFKMHSTNENVTNAQLREITHYYMFIILYDMYKGDVEEIAQNWLEIGYDILALVENENNMLIEFWDKILLLYKDNTLNKLYDDFKELAFSFSQYAQWPQESQFYLNGTTYHHYLFENIYEEEIQDGEDEVIGDYSDLKPPTIPENWPIPNNPILNGDFSDNEQDIHMHEISFKDFKYWQKYFALATVICLVPTYWNCGLDVLPWIQLIHLPCIFTAIYSIYIPLFDIVIVFGIAIRGMYISPIVLYVNASDHYASVTTPLIGVIKKLKQVFASKLEKIEYIPIQSIANAFITKFEKENEDLLKQNMEYEIYLSKLKTFKTYNQEYIKDVFKDIKNRYKNNQNLG